MPASPAGPAQKGYFKGILMAQAPAGQVRVSGVILLFVSGLLLGVGVWLTFIALSWVMPTWVPADLVYTPTGPALPSAALLDAPIGKAAAFVVTFAIVAGLNGLWNLIVGRRNRLLVGVLLLMFFVFLVVGAWATVQNEQGS
jgi:hypothetical protein